VDLWLWAVPLVSAGIGYVTNWVAIRMLFRPHEEKRVLNVRVPFTPGLIPRRRDDLARSIGRSVRRYLLTQEAVSARLHAPPVRAQIDDALSQALADIANPPLLPDPPRDLVDEVQALGLTLATAITFQPNLPPALRASLTDLLPVINRFTSTGNALSPDERAKRLARIQREYTAWRSQSALRIAAMLDTTPLEPTDLPDELLRPYVGKDDAGRTLYALEVSPMIDPDQFRGVTNPLDPTFLPRFIDDLTSVDPNATGVIMQVYRSGDLIFSSYQRAGVYALIAVFVLVLIDFRNVIDALLSLVPVVVGFTVTFAVMWLVGMPINAANIIVLPLMFGIGVDAGVHIIHRYRMDPTRPLGMTAGTGKGITITTLATIIGFGSMMLARHRGIASLGFVMSVGVGLTLLACWIVMPACLEVLQRHREKRAAANGHA